MLLLVVYEEQWETSTAVVMGCCCDANSEAVDGVFGKLSKAGPAACYIPASSRPRVASMEKCCRTVVFSKAQIAPSDPDASLLLVYRRRDLAERQHSSARGGSSSIHGQYDGILHLAERAIPLVSSIQRRSRDEHLQGGINMKIETVCYGSRFLEVPKPARLHLPRNTLLLQDWCNLHSP